MLNGSQTSYPLKSKQFYLEYIPVANEAAGLLTTFVRPSHIVIYAPRDSLTCRLPATSLNLSI
ncbi:hypothetical protein C9426_21230 [Serratia sp. S1B]|nr:hypothetical protein C9426_21230 [Serratia sp. S1B]